MSIMLPPSIIQKRQPHFAQKSAHSFSATPKTDSVRFGSSQSTSQKDTYGTNELVDKLVSYKPGYDAHYRQADWWDNLILFLKQYIPFIAKEYKAEYTAMIEALEKQNKVTDAQTKNETVKKALRLLTNVAGQINQKGSVTTGGWLSLGRLLNHLLMTDIQNRIAQFQDKNLDRKTLEALNPFESFLNILQNENCEQLHSFAITAMKDSPALESPEASVQTRVGNMYFLMLSYTANRIYENSALRNLQTYLGLGGKHLARDQEFTLSPFEADILTRYANRVLEPAQRADIQKRLYAGREIKRENFKRNELGQFVFTSSNLSDKSIQSLNAIMEKAMIINRSNIQAVFKLIEDTSRKLPHIREKVASGTLPYIIQKYPSGPVLKAMFEYLKEFAPTNKHVESLIRQMDAPNTRHIRLLLASLLALEVEKRSVLKPLFQEKLQQYGINPKDFTVFDSANVDALQTRLNEVVIGQDEAKSLLLRELTKMNQQPGHVPLLYLDGSFGLGKTSLAEKLAVELNTDLETQAFSTNPAAFEGTRGYHAFFNTAVISGDALASSEDFNEFRVELTSVLRKASQTAKQFPNRPAIIVLDEIGNLILDDANGEEQKKGQLLAQTILSIRQTGSYQDPVSKDVISFQKPILFLTGNVGGLEDSTDPFDNGLFKSDVIGPVGETLKKTLEQGHTVQFKPFTYEETIRLVDYFANTYIPQLAAGRQIRVKLPSDFSEVLAKAYQIKRFSGRDIAKHLRLSLIEPLEKAPVSPGYPVTVHINKDGLNQLDPEKLDTNRFRLDFMQENPEDTMQELEKEG